MAIQAQSPEIRLMTFNIKGDDGGISSQFNASQSWVYLGGLSPGRKERVIHVIGEFGPDILAVQEMKENQMNDLMDAFPEFRYYGEGRQGSTDNDRNGFFFRGSRFSLQDSGVFWLSEDPTMPGSTFQGGGTDTQNPRMVVWGILQDAVHNQSYFILTTHWSLDNQACTSSAALIRDTIEDLRAGNPVLMLGDFNNTPGSSQISTIKGVNHPGDVQLKDAYREVNVATTFERTFHNWGAYGTSGSRIDFCFFSDGYFVADSAWIDHWTDPANGYYPSDHYPVKFIIHNPAPVSAGGWIPLLMDLKLYPNPTSGILRVYPPGQHCWKLYSASGAFLKEGNCDAKGEIMLDGLEGGLYFLNLDGRVFRVNVN